MPKETENSVCVLIATKDRRILLEKALRSILQQSILPEEIIVINDGSSDDTSQYLEKFVVLHPNVKVFNFSDCRGVNVARNYGIRKTRSNWIIFLDDDDELENEAIFLAKKNISEIPSNYFLFYFNTRIKKDGKEFIGGFKFGNGQKYYDPTYEDVMTKFGLSGDCKVILRKSLFENDKYFFPESVNGFESITFRLIAKDEKKSRYYNNISTIVNLDSNFEHLSFSAPAKNPKDYLILQEKDLYYHKDFYYNHPDILKSKYKEIAKLAMRSRNYQIFFSYVVRSILVNISLSWSKKSMQNFLFKIFNKIIRLFGRLRWVRLGIRYRLILQMKYRNYKFVIPFFTYKYQGNLNDYIDRYVFYFGAYEIEELNLLKKYLNKDSIVIDIGANTGHHSLFFSRYAKEVYAFEPYSNVFNILQQRVLYNNIKNIHPFNFGIGDRDQFLDFFAPAGFNQGVGSFILTDNKNNIGKLEIKNGDNFIKSLDLKRVDLIKIDVEEMEDVVIKGLVSTIKKFRPVLFIEMIPSAQKNIFSSLENIFVDYNFYIVDANNPIFFIFNKPGCRLEKFKPKTEIVNILCVPID